MSDLLFGSIRIAAWEQWQSGLNRSRAADELTDDYGDSQLCQWQRDCNDNANGLHCSFYCSLGDWLNNISDELTDPRFDALTENDHQILFRYYTRILKLVSEVMEDFTVLHAHVKGYKKSGRIDRATAGKCFSELQFEDGELQILSNFINSVTKHKSEGRNLHVCNHHLKVVFEDFSASGNSNQISLDKQDWDNVDGKTTILMPSLNYLVGVVARLHETLGVWLENKEYKVELYKHYAGEYIEDKVNEE